MVDEGSLSNSPSIATAPESAPRDGRIPQSELDKNYRNFIRRVAGVMILAMADEDVDFATMGARIGRPTDEVRQWLMSFIECTTDEGRSACDMMYALGQRIEIRLQKLAPIANAIAEAPDSAEGVNP